MFSQDRPKKKPLFHYYAPLNEDFVGLLVVQRPLEPHLGGNKTTQNIESFDVPALQNAGVAVIISCSSTESEIYLSAYQEVMKATLQDLGRQNKKSITVIELNHFKLLIKTYSGNEQIRINENSIDSSVQLSDLLLKAFANQL